MHTYVLFPAGSDLYQIICLLRHEHVHFPQERINFVKLELTTAITKLLAVEWIRLANQPECNPTKPISDGLNFTESIFTTLHFFRSILLVFAIRLLTLGL